MSVIHRAVVASAAGVAAAATAAFVLAPAAGAQARSSGSSFIGHFHQLKTIASTVPGNGDVNPYGTVVIPQTQGDLHRGNVLISNFNNKKNLQGTGRTIVQITPGGKLSVFAKIRPKHLPGPCPGGIGLTTALTVLPGGWVVVGSLPTANGMAATAKAGCLLVLDSTGHVRETISGNGINGPWDMTSASFGNMAALFVTNVLNGTVKANGKVVHRGTVLRLNLALSSSQPPAVTSITRIGSGFPQRTDPAALVIGPTGVALNSQGTLFVANSLVSKINAIPFAVTRPSNAGTGMVVSTGGKLNVPLGLTVAPNGNVLTVNGGNGRIVETTPGGMQVASRFLDKSGSPPGAGALFGLAVAPFGSGVYYVDDAVNTLRLLH
jgi:hypothetical protein